MWKTLKFAKKRDDFAIIRSAQHSLQEKNCTSMSNSLFYWFFCVSHFVRNRKHHFQSIFGYRNCRRIFLEQLTTRQCPLVVGKRCRYSRLVFVQPAWSLNPGTKHTQWVRNIKRRKPFVFEQFYITFVQTILQLTSKTWFKWSHNRKLPAFLSI